MRAVASRHGLELVLLTTPTTAPERATAIARATQGFVYLVSVAGKIVLPASSVVNCCQAIQLSSK